MKRFSGIDVQGLKETQKILDSIAPKHARNLARATNQAVAAELKKKTQKNIIARGLDRTGNLRKSIKARRKKSPPEKPISVVFADAGKGKRHDGFYWRFIEYGTLFISATPFLGPALEFIRSQLESIYREKFMKKLEALIKREQKKFSK